MGRVASVGSVTGSEPREDVSPNDNPAPDGTLGPEVRAAPDVVAAPEPAATESGQSPTPDTTLERRAFVRRMGSDAVRTAGSVFSLSRILTRSAVAAGQAVATELESLQVGNAAEEPNLGAAGGAGVFDPAAAGPPAPEASKPPESSRPTEPASPLPIPASLLLDADQRLLLAAAVSAVRSEERRVGKECRL